MSTAIVWKAYENAQFKINSTGFLLPIRHADLNKFALWTFNKLAYKQKISGPLTVSYLFGLPNYYNYNISLQRINLNLLYCRFISVIFYGLNILQLSDNNAFFMGFIQPQACMFEYYWCRGTYFSKFSFYAYFAKNLVIKCKKFSKQVFEFEESYLHKLNLIQKHHINPGFDFLIALIEILF